MSVSADNRRLRDKHQSIKIHFYTAACRQRIRDDLQATHNMQPNAQQPLDTFPRRLRSCQLVANLLRTCQQHGELLKPCPHWRLESPNLATVAVFGDCCRIRRQIVAVAEIADNSLQCGQGLR